MSARRLRDYLARVDPWHETDDRLRLAARVGQLCEVLQAVREGSLPMTVAERRLVHSLVDAMTGDLLRGHHGDTLATLKSDDVVRRIRTRLG